MKITARNARDILGTFDSRGGGLLAMGPAGSVMADAPSLPADAMALPIEWRNVLSRCAWFASRDTLKGAFSCIELNSTHATAGSHEAAIKILMPCGSGMPMPFLLPSEIEWARVPGEDVAFLWNDAEGHAVLQTASGIRVTSARPTAALEPFPWSRYLENEDPTYSMVEVLDQARWLEAFLVAPRVVSLALQDDALLVSDVPSGYTHGWFPKWIELPCKPLNGAEHETDAVHVRGELMHRALVVCSPVVAVGVKGARDSVYVAGENDEWVVIMPIRQGEQSSGSSGRIKVTAVTPPPSRRPQRSSAPPASVASMLCGGIK